MLFGDFLDKLEEHDETERASTYYVEATLALIRHGVSIESLNGLDVTEVITLINTPAPLPGWDNTYWGKNIVNNS